MLNLEQDLQADTSGVLHTKFDNQLASLETKLQQHRQKGMPRKLAKMAADCTLALSSARIIVKHIRKAYHHNLREEQSSSSESVFSLFKQIKR